MKPAALRFFRFLANTKTRYVCSWILMASVTTMTLITAWRAFDAPKRRDGNFGHTTIDFGGQWLIGRMVALRLGRHLYHRDFQSKVLHEAYLQDDEAPEPERKETEKGKHDADELLGWLVKPDRPADTPSDQPVISGPLYPPIHALVMSPLGCLSPRAAYRTVQVVYFVLGFAAGWCIRQLSQGRIWWPIAVTGVMVYPGFAHGMNLGQNSPLLLALLLWGWVHIVRGNQIGGGLIWGLMAFKPVWPAAFFLFPLLTGRWRVCLAMIVAGLALAAATLPVVGVQSWIEWLKIGRVATSYYSTDENWVSLSRDLLNIPLRWLLDFEKPFEERFSLVAAVLGWTLFLSVLAATIIIAVPRKDRGRVLTGPPATFLLLGAFLSCYHFMYYDLLLTLLPIALLLLEPRGFLQPRLVAVVPLGSAPADTSLGDFYRPQFLGAREEAIPLSWLSQRNIYVLNSFVLSLLVFLMVSEPLFPAMDISASVSVPALAKIKVPMPVKYSTALAGTPWNTFCILAFWLWSGWMWVRSPARHKDAGNSTTAASPLATDAAQFV